MGAGQSTADKQAAEAAKAAKQAAEAAEKAAKEAVKAKITELDNAIAFIRESIILRKDQQDLWIANLNAKKAELSKL